MSQKVSNYYLEVCDNECGTTCTSFELVCAGKILKNWSEVRVAIFQLQASHLSNLSAVKLISVYSCTGF